VKTYSDAQLLGYDPFEGDRDTDVRLRSVKLSRLRKDATCMGNGISKLHQVQRGSRVRIEKAMFEGEWCRYAVCIPCISEWLQEIDVQPEGGVP